jgi:hypothetical protein
MPRGRPTALKPSLTIVGPKSLAYVAQYLAPTLERGDVVAMDDRKAGPQSALTQRPDIGRDVTGFDAADAFSNQQECRETRLVEVWPLATASKGGA